MKNFKNYSRIIAMKEHSAGNASVGDMWLETKSFPPETPVKDIIEWGKNCDGRLILGIDETDADDGYEVNF